VIKINTPIELCAAAIGSTYLFVTGALITWFVGAGAGLALSCRAAAGPGSFLFAGVVGFVVGPFRGSEFILNWVMLLILLITGIRADHPLVRWGAIGGILAIAVASGYRSGIELGLSC
jgi:hypothetical protein